MLRDEMTKHGATLFRYRSFLPFLILPLAIYYFAVFMARDTGGEGAEQLIQHLALLVSLSGLALRAFTVGYTPPNTSGRNTKQQKADRLNTKGPYSIVRHPLYTANFLIFAGFLLLFESLGFFLIGTLAFFLYYERIASAEESFLEGKFGERYRRWSARVPAFFPNPFLWRAPSRGFSVRKVFRRETPGWLLVVSVFTLFEIVEDVLFEHEGLVQWIRREPDWLAFLALGVALYCTSKLLRRRTSLLNSI
ncbi:methyltransferase family protein [Methyloligella solikamskensis]|uniref:Methyltransferase family protein n=1 Tax=Methyloligella solikamskensis TaxID=1177756 RepID=A0ABW3J546_9HYPH